MKVATTTISQTASKALQSLDYPELAGKACEGVSDVKEEAVAVASLAVGLTGGAATVTTATGVTVVAHSSGAAILTGVGGYIAGTLGTVATSTVAVLTAPATVAAAGVSLVVVGGAVYICQ